MLIASKVIKQWRKNKPRAWFDQQNQWTRRLPTKVKVVIKLENPHPTITTGAGATSNECKAIRGKTGNYFGTLNKL